MKSPAPTPPPLLLPADDDLPAYPVAPWPDLSPLASAQARRAWVRDQGPVSNSGGKPA